MQAPDAEIYAAFAAFLQVGTHDNPPRAVSFCDYASAGNTGDAKSFYRVWLPFCK